MTNTQLAALRADLDALRASLKASGGEADRRHLLRVERFGLLFGLVGLAASGWGVNPVAIIGISTALFVRWTMVAHHVVHRGYDKVPGVPERLTSRKFGRGWRRWLDWPDWMDVDAWRHEHNQLHHYRLGETADPDQPELNLSFLRNSRVPMGLRYLLVAAATFVWKPLYYAPNTMRALVRHKHRNKSAEPVEFLDLRMWSPFASPGKDTWLRCYIPYIVLHYGLLPLPWLALSQGAWVAAMINRLLAELLTNLHAWIIIVPNHAGEDVHRFDTPMDNAGEFYLRQIVGTVNYRTGGFWNDFFHGYLNYQIEHHLFPDLTMHQYELARPKVMEICERHGLPYLQESVFTRVRKLVRVLVGRDDMPVWQPIAGTESAAIPLARSAE